MSTSGPLVALVALVRNGHGLAYSSPALRHLCLVMGLELLGGALIITKSRILALFVAFFVFHGHLHFDCSHVMTAIGLQHQTAGNTLQLPLESSEPVDCKCIDLPKGPQLF